MTDETTPISESRSSVEIGTNAKGEPVIKVKVYAATTELEAADAAATKAVQVYLDTKENLG